MAFELAVLTANVFDVPDVMVAVLIPLNRFCDFVNKGIMDIEGNVEELLLRYCCCSVLSSRGGVELTAAICAVVAPTAPPPPAPLAITAC